MNGEPFTCLRCGNCCRPRGYVRLLDAEVIRVAGFLALDPHTFTDRFTRLTDDRRGLSLTEQADGSCVFLLPDGECRIQAVKPRQCREFPSAWRFDGYERDCRAMRLRETPGVPAIPGEPR
jgi:hypothetical protein